MASNAHGPVLWDIDARGVATVTLNRPEVNNAYDGAMIDGLLAALDAPGGAKGVRAVVLKGNGKHFQAGADLKWIKEVRRSAPDENLRVSRATAEAVQRLNMAPVPTVLPGLPPWVPRGSSHRPTRTAGSGWWASTMASCPAPGSPSGTRSSRPPWPQAFPSAASSTCRA